LVLETLTERPLPFIVILRLTPRLGGEVIKVLGIAVAVEKDSDP